MPRGKGYGKRKSTRGYKPAKKGPRKRQDIDPAAGRPRAVAKPPRPGRYIKPNRKGRAR